MTNPLNSAYLREASFNQEAHIASDVDVADTALHHSLGYGPGQAASGVAVAARLKALETVSSTTAAAVAQLALQRAGTTVFNATTDANGNIPPQVIYTTSLPAGLSSYGAPVISFGDNPGVQYKYITTSPSASGFGLQVRDNNNGAVANTAIVVRINYFVQAVK